MQIIVWVESKTVFLEAKIDLTNKKLYKMIDDPIWSPKAKYLLQQSRQAFVAICEKVKSNLKEIISRLAVARKKVL